MSQVNNITKFDEKTNQQAESNRFETCEQVVDALVQKGLPKIYNPSAFISKISQAYGLTAQEARTCIRMAVKQLENEKIDKKEDEKPQEELYAQSGYFYPSMTQASNNSANNKRDGFDSLSSLGSYKRLMFGIK